ncbi:ABC transporter ATP-binding protein [Tumebacillus permanentifrigoris]|uniref:ABC-2 type transport system ATP-binding protein n=1 Tax=Tumebacillus permanentifrigoris TaxID=378543 RepID=A0A316D409_9BACL|nr:ABC transporter ATP-binding protein [Tumebacillus permanentifrigoris]PWK05940.1 ABC-2 type transport system ATP-binding protein [Tumebacillus permanentifrigoris]
MKQAIVEIRGLTKEIGGKLIVEDLSFDVREGEVLGLLGPNGAGKTTTIRMIVGLISRTAGTVKIGGVDLGRDFEAALAQVGAIVENPEMYKFLTGWQNLVHFARMSKGVSEARIEEVVRLVGLEQRIKDKVKTYSLGMRQRLGLAQALLHRPRVLILDEPTNGLDPAGIRELRDHLRRLAEQEGIAVIVSSHLLAEMELMCDRIAVMQQGQLVSVTSLHELVGPSGAEQLLDVQFEVDAAEPARQILTAYVGDANLVRAVDRPSSSGHPHSELLTVHATRKQIPDLNARLVQAGIAVYGIRTTVKTLEDKFLELTGGGGIG